MQDRAEAIAPPPVVYLVPLVAGLILHWVFPVRFLHDGFQLGIGLPLVGVGIILAVWAVRTFRRVGTSVNIYKPTKVIAIEGPFRFSRNPMYLSLSLAYVGIAVSLNALWALLLLPIALFLTQYGVIIREEHYLERKFGEEYLQYKRRVRRWL